MALRLVFLGPPGAGKGTIAQRLSDRYGLVQIATGDLLREEAKKQTVQGRKIRELIDSGKYVEDEIAAKLVEDRLAELGKEKGFILDGFPRTIKQAELLQESLGKLHLQLDAALDIEASDETIIERLGARVQCSKCGRIYNLRNIPPKDKGKCDACSGTLVHREDDRPSVVKMRLETYRRKTKPLIDFYEERGLLKVVDANAGLQENMQNVEKALSELKKGKNN